MSIPLQILALYPITSVGHLGQSSCQSDEFLCGNGKCLPHFWKCNGQDECGDATDERSCSLPPTEAHPGLCSLGSLPCTDAQSTRCLPAALRCNGVQDCHDGTDELGCPDTTCGKHLRNFYGSFASPDFFHSNRSTETELRCSWLLDTQDPKPIMLQLDLQLGPRDSLHVYDGLLQHAEHLLQVLSHSNNRHPALLESSRGQMSLLYMAQHHSPGHGFNATYQVLLLGIVYLVYHETLYSFHISVIFFIILHQFLDNDVFLLYPLRSKVTVFQASIPAAAMRAATLTGNAATDTGTAHQVAMRNPV